MIVEVKSGNYETVKNKAEGQWGLWSFDESRFLVNCNRWVDRDSDRVALIAEEPPE